MQLFYDSFECQILFVFFLSAETETRFVAGFDARLNEIGVTAGAYNRQ